MDIGGYDTFHLYNKRRKSYIKSVKAASAHSRQAAYDAFFVHDKHRVFVKEMEIGDWDMTLFTCTTSGGNHI